MGQLTQIIPFAGVLLSFAILPGLLPRFWHRRMAMIIGFWVLLGVLLQTFERGGRAAGLALWQVTFTEFLPFIVLLLALYALGGGISIRGGALGRPGGNLLLLIAGTILASIMGTIGAALLLIHPLLAANGYRYEKRHLVIAFIILVGNCGGALSPLGDPPLLVGFLRGVPFFWPLTHLLLPLLLLAVPVLALTFGLDVWLARQEPRPRPEKLRIRGLLNILLLLLLIAVIPLEGVWHPGNVTVLAATIPGEHLAVMLVEAGCILVSEMFTPKAIRSQNRFAWQAMREIIILFFAIFATIGPGLHPVAGGADPATAAGLVLGLGPRLGGAGRGPHLSHLLRGGGRPCDGADPGAGAAAHRDRRWVGVLRAGHLSRQRAEPDDPRDRRPAWRADAGLLRLRRDHDPGHGADLWADELGVFLRKGKASFCEQKEAKKLFYAGPWALSPTQPHAQHKKVFAPLFSKSGHFPSSKPPKRLPGSQDLPPARRRRR